MSAPDKPQTFDCRNAYAATITDLARQDPKVQVVFNDSIGSSKLDKFVAEFPEQTVNVGIAEQNMVGVAAGLANGGMTPFVSGAGCFLTARSMEQVKADLAYSNYHVVLCAMSPGVAYGPLGATHHSIEDVAWMRTLPNMTVLVPSDPAETEQCVRWAYTHDGPVYLRISRMSVPAVSPEGYQFAPGKAVLLREGTDVTIIANGTVVHRALAAAEQLAQKGVSARVLSMASIKPFDEAAVIAAARETRGIVTAEEGLQAGGLGGAVAECVVRNNPCKVVTVGLPDCFAPTGSAGSIMDEFGISAEGITAAALTL